MSTPKRAIGIIRVSETAGREGDRFHSPEIQRERIERDCKAWGLESLTYFEELDVSGGKPIHQRPGLREALAMVECGQAEAIVFAYRDRVERSIDTASELCRRMDAAGGLLIADGKQITHSTHDGWRHATLESFLNEDQRRAVAEKIRDVHARCIREGKVPFIIPPGYRRRPDGGAEPDESATVVRAAWVMRAEGHSVSEIQRFLARYGVNLSIGGVVKMFERRFYLGELHYGGYEPNLHAHEPLVTPELFEAVQRRKGTLRGRRAKSERLLARQGILYCKGCGARLSVSSSNHGRNPFYRCNTADCPAPAIISTALVEGLVLDRVRELCEGLVGRASAASKVQEAKDELGRRQVLLDHVIGLLASAGISDEPTAVEQARRLKEGRDAAQRAYDEALTSEVASQLAVTADVVLEHGSLEGKRELVRAVIERVDVAKGRGSHRVSIRDRVDHK